MPVADTDVTSVVVAARSGDRPALEELAAAFLPLVYSVVSRALPGDPDIDDVVQDVMLRAVRDLPTLREPSSFRAWLMAIAVRQIGTHLHRRRTTGARVAPLTDAADLAHDDMTMLHVVLSEQRRQVARAAGWLDPADRMLLSLWWLEQVGQVTRQELGEAAGLRGAHLRVRVQRMREQLELGRSVVAALESTPRCAALAAAAAGWDGAPNPLWRKRLARHIRSCADCQRATAGQVPTERLLDFALLPVPMALAAAVLRSVGADGSAGVAKPSLLAKAASVLAAHPVAAPAVVAVAVAAAAALAMPWSPHSPPSRPAAVELPTGPVSLEVATGPGQYAATADNLGVVIRVDQGSGNETRRRATFEVTPGIADPACYTLRTADGRYLRHSSWRLRADRNEGTPLFRGDATFCVRPGSEPESVSLEASNYPGWFLRQRDGELWVDHVDGSAAFRAETAFRVRQPWAE